MSVDVAMQELWKDHGRRRRDSSSAILPRLFGKWNRDDHSANCQGKTQMLAAFARLAGARTMAIEPVRTSNSVMNNWRYELLQLIQSDLDDRQFRFPDPELMNGIHGEYLSLMRKRLVHDFHACIALQLRDCRWVMIDPHSLAWGIFPDVWNVAGVDSLLTKYRDVLPGLTVMSHDPDTMVGIKADIDQQIARLFEKSRRFEAALLHDRSLDAVKKIMLEMDILDDVIALTPELDREYMSIPMMKELMIHSIVTGGDPLDVSKMMEFVTNPDKQQKFVDSISTLYHTLAMNTIMNDQINAGNFLHPECFFGNTEYQIAISCINSATDNRSALHRFFLDYSFCLCEYFNAMIVPEQWRCQEDRDMAMASVKVCSQMPFKHEQIKRRLEWFR
jgi:hypothetical protein